MSSLAFVEIITASQGLLPGPCAECLWWQTTQGQTTGTDRRLQWMAQLEHGWGSVGLVALEGDQTVAAIQFAPVWALPRAHLLPPAAPPDDAVLFYCLRGRIGRPAYEAHKLLHRAMAHLRRRRTHEVYAYARPLGSNALCGIRNLFGLEFLEANGFEIVQSGPEHHLVRADLRGLVPALAEAGSTVRRLTGAVGRPSPVTFESS
ncbi:MAG: hypothetical protein Kow00122_03950 [Thermoleophilia bacterium]